MIFDVAGWFIFLPYFIIFGAIALFIIGIVVAVVIIKKHKK